MKTHILKPREQRKKKEYRIDLLKLLLLIAFIAAIVAILYKPAISLLQEENRLALKEQINSYGFPAHLLFIGAVALQVVLSIIPAGATMPILGGFIFGPWLGMVYTVTGTVLGSALSFYLGRKFGRPILEDYVDPKLLRKFDKQSEGKGLITLLFIFLIPFTPDNAVCLIAGTTKMRIKNMVIVAAIGRLPGTMVGCLIGAGLTDFSIWSVVAIAAILALLFFGYYYREKLEEKAKMYFAKRHIKKFEKKKEKKRNKLKILKNISK